MDFIFEAFDQLIDPDWIMKKGGLYLVLIILFIETGIIFGFFLPGDPLLFVSGVIIASIDETPYPFDSTIANLIFWEILFITSTILGYFVGYWFGTKFGHLYKNRKKDSWFLKKRHIESAHSFYEKKGGFAITIARFLPIVRTFVPIVGGMVKMNFRLFSIYNVLGSIIWVGTITTLGFFLGKNEWVARNLEWTLLGIVAVFTLPVILKMMSSRKRSSAPQ